MSLFKNGLHHIINNYQQQMNKINIYKEFKQNT